VPRDLTTIRSHYTTIAKRLREQREALDGHYHPDLIRQRVEAAICDETGLTPWELRDHVNGVTSTVLRKVS
jgi:hypothetical protein